MDYPLIIRHKNKFWFWCRSEIQDGFRSRT